MLLEGISLVLADVNGQPGAVAKNSSARTVAAISLEIADDQVYATRAVTNPDKLAHLLD